MYVRFDSSNTDWKSPGADVDGLVGKMTLLDLLLQSEAVPTAQLAEAKRLSVHSGLPIGKILVFADRLLEEDILIALNILVRLRDDAMFSSEDATSVMKAFVRAKADATDPQLDLRHFRNPISKNGILIGDLLVEAGLVERDLVTGVLEISLLKRPLLLETPRKPTSNIRELVLDDPIRWSERGPLIGQVFIEQNLINEDVLTAALRVQSRVAAGDLSPEEAPAEL